MQGPRGIIRDSLGQLVPVRERLTCWLTHLTHVAAVCPKGLTLTNDTSTCIDMGIVDIGKKAYSDPNLNAALNLTRVRHDTFVNRLLEVISRLRSNESFCVQSQMPRPLASMLIAPTLALALNGIYD